MNKWFKLKWHWFWYKHYLHKSTRNGRISNDGSFEKSFYHGMEVHKLDPTGLKKFADECVKRACGTENNA